jgi:ADP-ribose pyrophosphatase YjhB (NUDIX family)
LDYWETLRAHVGHTPLIISGAAGAIVRDDKILLVFHKQKKLWQVPGGFQEYGESLEQTIAREIREELSINLEARSLIALFSSGRWNIQYPNGDTVQQLCAFYLLEGEFNVDDIRIQESEIAEFGFFPLDRIPENTFECCKRKVEIVRNWDGVTVFE